MTVHNLSENNSLLNNFIGELRDQDIQTDRMRFRKNMERVGEIFAYEISKELQYSRREIRTSLGTKDIDIMKSNIVLASILRAGLPFHYGLMNFFDQADNAFVGSYRKYHKDNTFEIKSGYLSSPPADDKYLILADPMLASGASMVLAYKDICADKQPIHTHIVSIIAAKDGIDHLKLHLAEENITIWVGDIDDELTAKGYIVPGLGDAGDLAFGQKEQGEL